MGLDRGVDSCQSFLAVSVMIDTLKLSKRLQAETREELRDLLRQIDPKILAECGIV
jgi:hypothetical protein